uniref:uncharacterized protein LOC122587736 n=1 Tax=Erigeron canadensis TaxID=72917 RepID=UPI001CB9B1EF|nr:uncharacterized protein LOC122587736 [Erigeron canadensis]
MNEIVDRIREGSFKERSYEKFTYDLYVAKAEDVQSLLQKKAGTVWKRIEGKLKELVEKLTNMRLNGEDQAKWIPEEAELHSTLSHVKWSMESFRRLKERVYEAVGLIMTGNNGSTTPSSHASVNPSNTNTMSSDSSKRSNRDMAWEWGDQRDPNNKSIVWCQLCNKKMGGGGITRLKQHLTHTGGQVSGCEKVTTEITKKVLASMREKDQAQLEKKKRNREILRSCANDYSEVKEGKEAEVDNDDVQEVVSKESVSNKNKFVSPSNTRGPMDVLLNTDFEKTKKSSLDRNNPIKEKLKMRAWDKFATWAYSVGLPFNVVRDEGFQDFINAVGDYGRGMPAPSYHNIRVTLLKSRLEETKRFVDSFRPHWKEYKCSIMSDFWTDGKGRCLINFLVNCLHGTIFLKSIDASEHVKNSNLIVHMINDVIEDVGERNIVQDPRFYNQDTGYSGNG